MKINAISKIGPCCAHTVSSLQSQNINIKVHRCFKWCSVKTLLTWGDPLNFLSFCNDARQTNERKLASVNQRLSSPYFRTPHSKNMLAFWEYFLTLSNVKAHPFQSWINPKEMDYFILSHTWKEAEALNNSAVARLIVLYEHTCITLISTNELSAISTMNFQPIKKQNLELHVI